jgi:hypothetical protein
MVPPMTPVTSARDARSVGIRTESARTFAAGFFDAGAHTGKRVRRPRRIASRASLAWRRVRGRIAPRTPAWRWVTLLYVVVALAAPLIMYAGPDVLSPAAPVIADDALDGALSLHLRERPGSDLRQVAPAR